MDKYLFILKRKIYMKAAITGAATGAMIGGLCSHFGFDPVLHWTCVICSSIIMGMLI